MTIVRQGAYLPGTTQNFNTTSSSQYANVVGSTTGIVRVAVNQDTYVQIGNVTRNTSGNIIGNVSVTVGNAMLIPAGGVEFFASYEANTQIAFQQVLNPGNICITELL